MTAPRPTFRGGIPRHRHDAHCGGGCARRRRLQPGHRFRHVEHRGERRLAKQPGRCTETTVRQPARLRGRSRSTRSRDASGPHRPGRVSRHRPGVRGYRSLLMSAPATSSERQIDGEWMRAPCWASAGKPAYRCGRLRHRYGVRRRQLPRSEGLSQDVPRRMAVCIRRFPVEMIGGALPARGDPARGRHRRRTLLFIQTNP